MVSSKPLVTVGQNSSQSSSNTNNNNNTTTTSNCNNMIYEETINLIKSRYVRQKSIYTWCGIALVAINPYQDLDIYGEQAVETYHAAAHSGYLQLDPHIYAVTEDAYSKLDRDGRNQSIIVSGESGAGKTVSAKLAMKYFASIASTRAKIRIENRVLASNPIMEAIGNASTIRNDNSSRFGKYIQIYFDRQNKRMLGADMRTYLLEKSRVTKQQAGERNFHIFYQLLNYARKNFQETSHLKLAGDQSSRPFKYLGGIEPHETLDDLTKFEEAFKTLGIDQSKCDIVYRIVAGILHGGNIEFKVDGDESCKMDKDDFHLKSCCELLEINIDHALDMLTSQRIQVRSDVIFKPINRDFAEYGRDAMFKSLYDQLFIYLVNIVNASLNGKNREPTASDCDSPMVLKSPLSKKTFQDQHNVTSSNDKQFIGVLDIYGFENFDLNSFEQFCINYANEVLQQQFNQHVFKLEQEEYIREEIDWTFIEFTDNQPVIDIIESKPIGILNLLDEECRMPKGTDLTWCAKLYQQLKSVPNSEAIFKQPKFNSQKLFTICHYAEEVTYTVDTFLEKNRDTLLTQQVALLADSPFLMDIFNATGQSQSLDMQKTTMTRMKTIATRFRMSLSSLMETLNSTEPHYIRCIKPNDTKKSFVFNDDRVVEQLRACGVYETIRISTNGFPSRWPYKEFAKKFLVLTVGLPSSIDGKKTGKKFIFSGQLSYKDARPVCERICELTYTSGIYDHLLLPCERDYIEELKARASATSCPIYQFGKTKIFFRSRQVNFLERIRSHKLRQFATTLQRHIRGWLAKKYVQKLREELYERMRREKASLLIQTNWRRVSAQRRYKLVCKCITKLQQLARQRLVLKNKAATRIQKVWRGYKCRREFKSEVKRIVTVQASVRRYLARRQYKKLKIEAKSVERMKTLNYGLERKIIELQQKINESNENYKQTLCALKADCGKKQSKIQQLEATNKSLQQKIDKANGERAEQANYLCSMIDNMYFGMVELFFLRIQPLVVDAVLEYDGLDSAEPFASLESKISQTNINAMDLLINELELVHELITERHIHQEIALLIFKQLFYLICAQCLNRLLLRTDLCHWNKALQIRFNLSCLEQWCREKHLWKWQEVVEQLDPITQSTKLLQTRKTSEHIPSIVEMCSKLRPSQIIKILNMYTSSYEEQISTDFMRALENYLAKDIALLKKPTDKMEANNNVPNNNNDLLMDTKKLFTFSSLSQLQISS